MEGFPVDEAEEVLTDSFCSLSDERVVEDYFFNVVREFCGLGEFRDIVSLAAIEEVVNPSFKDIWICKIVGILRGIVYVILKDGDNGIRGVT